MSRPSYDVAIIGATRAGRAVAAAARRRGARVVMVDHDPRLRAYESSWNVLRSRLLMAWTALQPLARATDLAKAVATRIFENEAKVGHSLSIEESSDPGMVLLQGPVELRSGHEIVLADRRVVRSESIVLAPGSRPRRPGRFFQPGLPVDDPVSFLGESGRARSVVIVGADWSGCEWAFVLACLGCSVLLVDRRSRLLRSLDAEFRLCIQEHLHGMGVEVVLGEEISGVDRGAHGGVEVRLGSGRREICESVLILAGNVGDTGRLGVEPVGVAVDADGHVVTDDFGRSSVPSVLATGSVVDSSGLFSPSLTHGEAIAANALGEQVPLDTDLPWVLTSYPQVGVCGLTAETCAMLDLPVVVGSTSHCGGDEGPGLARVVADRHTGKLLGAQVLGWGAADAIHSISNAIRANEGVQEVLARDAPPGFAAERLWQVCADLAQKIGRPDPGLAIGRLTAAPSE